MRVHLCGLKAGTILPTVLDLVSSSSINRCFRHCKRVVEAYGAGEVCGTKKFRIRVIGKLLINEKVLSNSGFHGHLRNHMASIFGI